MRPARVDVCGRVRVPYLLPTTYQKTLGLPVGVWLVVEKPQAQAPSRKQEQGTTQAPAKLEPPGYWASNL